MAGLTLTQPEFDDFRTLLAEMSGILVGMNKGYLIETRLGSLALEKGCSSFTEFHRMLSNGADPKLKDKVVDLMTTNETLWFRDTHPFEIFKQVLLPEFEGKINEPGGRTVRIWSAGCSTGQEPYSIAMTILERMRTRPALKNIRFEILASDISSTALRLAKMGRYESLAISRGLTDEFRDRYFLNEGRVWSVSDEVREMVTLKKVNLQDSFSLLGRFDVLLCRNVAIYFSDEFKRELFAKFARVLNPGGVFFMGASESLAAHSTAFDMNTASAGVYYRLRAQGGAAR